MYGDNFFLCEKQQQAWLKQKPNLNDKYTDKFTEVLFIIKMIIVQEQLDK